MNTLHEQVAAWAAARTSKNSKRYDDLIRDKTNALLGDDERAAAPGFFTFCKKPVGAVTAADVRAWVSAMSEAGLSAATIYARVSRVSSFYDWLNAASPEASASNPAKAARPNAPDAYATGVEQSLTEEQVARLFAVVRDRATVDGSGALSAKRDLVLLHFYFGTGRRRDEIIRLRWEDVELDGPDVLMKTDDGNVRVSGARASLVAYLRASNRWDDETNTPRLGQTAPLWLRHDRAAKGREAVTSHGFVYMLKRYAKAAGLGNLRLNQARHTAAKQATDNADSLEEVQRRLGFQSRSMAQAYLRRLRGEADGEESDG